MPLNTEVDYNNVVIKGTVELGVKGERGLQGFKGDQGPPVPVAHELGDDPDLAVSQKLLTDSIADMEQSNEAAVLEATHQAGLAGDSAVTATEQAGIATTKAGEASSSASDAASSASNAADSETAAEQAATIATNKADEAAQAAEDAIAAAGAIGPILFYENKQSALDDIANIPDGSIIEIAQDESDNDARTRYRKSESSLSFLLNLDKLRSDLSDFSGIVTDEGWPNVPSLADVELDVQSDALAKRTNRLKRSVLENGIARLLPNSGYSYVAHRGFSSFAPENTIPSFTAAARSGFKFVECDLINAGDGDFVIIHDNTLDRTTDSTGDVREMTVAQIKAATIDFGASLIPAVLSNLPTLFPSLKVPTLEEFLKCCHKFGLHPIFEAKLYTPELRDQFLKRVMQILPLGGFSLLSSDITSLNHYRSMSDAVTLGWLASPTPSNIDVCASLGNSFISFSRQDAALNAAAVRLAKEKGILTNVWVVNNSRDAQDMIALQIDLISTDNLI